MDSPFERILRQRSTVVFGIEPTVSPESNDSFDVLDELKVIQPIDHGPIVANFHGGNETGIKPKAFQLVEGDLVFSNLYKIVQNNPISSEQAIDLACGIVGFSTFHIVVGISTAIVAEFFVCSSGHGLAAKDASCRVGVFG
jgi:hypothetical protein